VKRSDYARLIAQRLEAQQAALTADWNAPGQVRTFVLDDLLPVDAAREIHQAFPAPAQMMKKHSLRESKYVAAQLDRHPPVLEEITFAFQDPRVMALFSAITGVTDLLPDPRLYAGGISTMVKDGFLNPHLDNSHDGQQKHYRVLNTLYYVTPDWREDDGGSLELWDQGPRGQPRRITSRFNRLVMMETNRRSWHSVTPVRVDGRRTCVSNYFFREKSLEGSDYFHATSFRGRPEQPLRDLVLRADNALRTAILSVVNVPTKHIYKRSA
jgi:Rps23 Pro-64 3,4-dihydroxylase Tpa1-like proline 4-hydroxylase